MTTIAIAGRTPGRWRAQDLTLPVLLLGTVLLLMLLEPRFLSTLNLMNVLRGASLLGIVAIGQALVLIVGGFDLAVGAVVAAASVVSARTMLAVLAGGEDQAVPAMLAGVLAGLGGGALIGAASGLLVARFRLNAFMTTLAVATIVSGLAYYVTTGIPVYGIPREFTETLGRGTVLGLPVAVFTFVGLAALAWLMMRHSRIGLHLYAVGGNARAARVSGVAAERCIVLAYALSGVLAAVVGVLLSARLGSGQANIGAEFTLLSIAAAVVGGVSLRGGVGDLRRVALSAVFLAVIGNGMNLLHVDTKLQTLLLGGILMLAVAIDEFGKRKESIE